MQGRAGLQGGSQEGLFQAHGRPIDENPSQEQCSDLCHQHTTSDPLCFPDQVKEELNSMVAQGIIKPAGDEPPEWCHPLVVVSKDLGDRITVDLTKLNSKVTRPTHPSPTPFAAGEIFHDCGCVVWILANGTC